MNKRQSSNLPASIRQRLLNLSRDRGEDFNLTLTRYGIERLLYRLSQSEQADQFVLKGALLLSLWTGRLRRPTRDLDLLTAIASSLPLYPQLLPRNSRETPTKRCNGTPFCRATGLAMVAWSSPGSFGKSIYS